MTNPTPREIAQYVMIGKWMRDKVPAQTAARYAHEDLQQMTDKQVAKYVLDNTGEIL